MSIFKITGPHGSIYVVADEVNLQALLFDQYAVEVDGIELQDFYSVKRIADYKGEKLDGKKKLEEVIKRLNITNSYAADYIRKNTANINFSLVDEEKFDEWFNSQIDYLRSGRYRASLFCTAFAAEYKKGTFKVIDCHESKEVIKPGTLEPIDSFEAKVDEWIELIYETTGQYPDSEARAFDKNGNLRGYYDGKGGFFYTDGTVSSKWPCGLPPVKKDPSSHNKEIEQKILEGLT